MWFENLSRHPVRYAVKIVMKLAFGPHDVKSGGWAILIRIPREDGTVRGLSFRRRWCGADSLISRLTFESFSGDPCSKKCGFVIRSR